jgi:hypothetical protein
MIDEEHEVAPSFAAGPAVVERHVVSGWFVEVHASRRAMSGRRGVSEPEHGPVRPSLKAAHPPGTPPGRASITSP